MEEVFYHFIRVSTHSLPSAGRGKQNSPSGNGLLEYIGYMTGVLSWFVGPNQTARKKRPESTIMYFNIPSSY